MKNGHKLLHYKFLQEFQNQFYDGVLTQQDLLDEVKHFDKFKKILTDEEEKNANFAAYEFNKDNTKYLLQAIHPDKHPDEGQRLDVDDKLPIVVNETNPISYRDVVYERIKDYSPVRIRPKKTMSYKELINSLAAYHHTNKKDYQLYWMLVMSSYIDRCYFRIATAPNFGKDSAIKMIELLKGDATSTNAEVSRAKLEYLTDYSLLGITELADLAAEDWRNMEQFLLDVAAFLPKITKRSRSYQGVDEILNVENFSSLLLYNDLKDYYDKDRYFDMRAKSAIKDRFPAIRLAGEIQDDRIVEVEDLDVTDGVQQNMQSYKKLLYAFQYWMDNYEEEQNREWTADFFDYPQRWQKNLKILSKSINLYAESEEEYNEYVDLLKDRLEEYDRMLDFVYEYEDRTDDMNRSTKKELDKQLDSMHTYKDKVTLLRNPGDKVKGGKTLADF